MNYRGRTVVSAEQIEALSQLAEKIQFTTSADGGRDCWGATLHGEVSEEEIYLVGESMKGNEVEVYASITAMEVDIRVDSTRSALSDGGNRAGELFLAVSEVIPPETFQEIFYKSWETRPQFRKYWWLSGSEIKWVSSGAKDLVGTIRNRPDARPQARIFRWSDFNSTEDLNHCPSVAAITGKDGYAVPADLSIAGNGKNDLGLHVFETPGEWALRLKGTSLATTFKRVAKKVGRASLYSACYPRGISHEYLGSTNVGRGFSVVPRQKGGRHDGF